MEDEDSSQYRIRISSEFERSFESLRNYTEGMEASDAIYRESMDMMSEHYQRIIRSYKIRVRYLRASLILSLVSLVASVALISVLQG